MDLQPEERLTMADVRRLLGKRRGGKLITPSTLWRWYRVGVRGVVLQTRVEGGMRITTRGWLDEFFRAIKAKRDGKAELPMARTASQRKKAGERAGERLEARGA
jgi:hypothetical protein